MGRGIGRFQLVFALSAHLIVNTVNGSLCSYKTIEVGLDEDLEGG